MIIAKIRYYVFVIILFFSVQTGWSQDAAFSQYYASALYLNPSLAAIEPNWAVSLNYRSQWRSLISTPYVTSQASFMMPFYSKNASERHWGGAGVSVFNDRAGEALVNITGANANFAYNVPLSSDHNVIFGLQGGVIYKTLDRGSEQWGSQYDPDMDDGFNRSLDNPAYRDNIVESKVMPDVGAGVLYYFNPGRDYTERGFSAYLGFAGYHLNMPNESMIQGIASRLPILLKGHGGVEVSLSDRFNFSPNVLVAMQNNVNQVNVGAYFTYMFAEQKNVLAPTAFILGGWYRLRDAAIISTGIGNAYYTIGFSYDVNSSNLRINTRGRGAYEISLKITKPNQKKKVRFYTPRI